jgi:hypothetical protein
MCVNQVQPTLTATNACQAQPHCRNSSSVADDHAMAKQDFSAVTAVVWPSPSNNPPTLAMRSECNHLRITLFSPRA